MKYLFNMYPQDEENKQTLLNEARKLDPAANFTDVLRRLMAEEIARKNLKNQNVKEKFPGEAAAAAA